MTQRIPTPTYTSSDTTMPPPDFTTWLDEDLLRHYEWTKAMQAEYSDQAGRVEQAIMRRLAERGATAIPSETFDCELRTTCTYNQDQLMPLLEILNAVELERCYQPAYTPEPVEVPAKWLTVQLLAVARRRGTEALALVERAKVETGRRLNFSRRTP